jgi:hypothetical protein
MNFSGSANRLLNFSTAVTLLLPLLAERESMMSGVYVQHFQKSRW